MTFLRWTKRHREKGRTLTSTVSAGFLENMASQLPGGAPLDDTDLTDCPAQTWAVNYSLKKPESLLVHRWVRESGRVTLLAYLSS